MSGFRRMDWTDVFLYGLVVILVAVVVCFIVWYITLPTIVSEGVIIDKYITPGRTTYITTYVNKVAFSSPIYAPERPTFVIRRTDGSITKIKVDDEVYYSHEVGDKISFSEKEYR